MSSKKNNSNEKHTNIDDYYVGDFIIFNLHGKRCVGCISSYSIWDFKEENYETIVVVNYLTENGIIGSIPAEEIPKSQTVFGIKMFDTFKHLDKANENSYQDATQHLKNILNNNDINFN